MLHLKGLSSQGTRCLPQAAETLWLVFAFESDMLIHPGQKPHLSLTTVALGKSPNFSRPLFPYPLNDACLTLMLTVYCWED